MAPRLHTLDHLSTSWLMQTSGRSWLALKGRSLEAGRGASTNHGWAAKGSAQVLGAEAYLATAKKSTCPGSLVSPRRGQSPFPPVPQLWHRTPSVESEAGRACARFRPDSRPRPCFRLSLPRSLRSLTIVVDPGRLQELHCSAAGLRREPRPSARPGHGATAAASSRAARPPAAARPAPSVPPRHRRPAPQAAATAALRARPPPPPPQPHPLHRSSSGGSRATPEVTARTCQIAPAGNLSPRGRGRPGPSREEAGKGGSASGPAAVQPPMKEGRLGPRRASGSSSCSPGRRWQTGSRWNARPLSSSTSPVPSPTN